MLPSAFEDKPLCVHRQLAKLLQLSVEKVCADFDAMLRHDWRRLGISAARSLAASSRCGSPAQRLQSLHAARKGLPHRHHVVQLAGASARSRTARTCRSARPGLLLLRRAVAPVLLVERLTPPPQHLVLLRQLSDPGAPPQSQPAALRRAADGHLGALRRP